MKFSNTYSQLDSAFYQRIAPTKVAAPQLLLWNKNLASDLLIDEMITQDQNLLAQYFSGNLIPDGAEPMALAYSGHQFGHFNPNLGDGRAHLLGEIITSDNKRYDIQLKGSGPTQFSRQGDGRCAIGPAVREYIMSEAMFALGVPTSRCLSVVITGEPVYREQAMPGAVVTRVASSHIRVGTFQYFAAKGDLESLSTLTDYTINRHFSHININAEDKIEQFLECTIDKQIELIVAWMRTGFIHGVMNTDNTAISGETIDFGPCAMMSNYHSGTVFSSIDKQGRYAFGNQPHIAQWNMARLAECLLLLVDANQEKALEKIEPLIIAFTDKFETAYFTMLANKLGLNEVNTEDHQFINELLEHMQKQALDYTNTFIKLTDSLTDTNIQNELKQQFGDWYANWLTMLASKNQSTQAAKTLMTKNNPLVIPRNHHVEAILAEYETSGQSAIIDSFLEVLRAPYEQQKETSQFQDEPKDGDHQYRTFCGT
ncbi:YdiU family protein [Pseudoalteromonas sp. C2R02]|uniref:protein adenylyltransferase SelO n=1 Tax=Pseudoalteromonas sp. C2R02 TaxID=2841565 RepID=UPI001C099D63|nr:YdiU family protein [Pseudoalteromonas sp. C2R02]MBU2971380.1 YdiU family protein [Pseudoalteromonas sp. C2R02]